MPEVFISDDIRSDCIMHDQVHARWLAKLPVCSECEEPIQDEWYYNLFGKLICKSCMHNFEEYNQEV